MPEKPANSNESVPAKDPPMTRRDVFGALGLAGAAAAMGGAAAVLGGPSLHHKGDATGLARQKPYVPGAEHFGSDEEKWVATSCGQCPAGCGVRVRVAGGRAVRIEGNVQNPLNRGGIGPRGLSGLQALYDADRIPGPLVREGGKLISIPWDRAISLLTEKLTAVRKEAPHRLLVMSGRERGFMHDLWARFAKAFGTPNFVDGRPSRSSVFAQAFFASIGHFELPSYDWAGVELVLSLEAGVLEDSCQLVYLARSAAELHRGNAGHRTAIIHAGPVFDLSAHNADDWLMIEPGTSCALALGLAHVLIRDELYDKGFVADFGEDFDAFYAMVLKDFPPERTAELCGLRPARIVELAHYLASRRPSFVYADERTLAFSNGWETALAVLALNALLGAMGTLVRPEPLPPFAAWPDAELDEIARAGLAKPRLDQAGTPAFPFAQSIHETLVDALSGPDAPSVVLLDHANPAYARKQPDRWRKALAAVPFVVSFSPFRDETVEFLAHLVLPDHTFFERWDDAGSAPSTGTPVAGVRRPVVQPILDTRATGDILVELAHSLGGAPAAAFPWRTSRDALDQRMRGLYEARRGSIIEPKESVFLNKLYERGFWADQDAPPIEIKRFTFHAGQAESEWQGDEKAFPLRLLPYRPVTYAEGSGANLPWLRQVRSRPNLPNATTFATVHPDSALGIDTGDMIEITSPFGTILAAARIEPRMLPGYVAVPMGGGHEAFGRWAIGRGANVMRLLAPGAAPHTGANSLCTTRIRIARRGGPQ